MDNDGDRPNNQTIFARADAHLLQLFWLFQCGWIALPAALRWLGEGLVKIFANIFQAGGEKNLLSGIHSQPAGKSCDQGKSLKDPA